MATGVSGVVEQHRFGRFGVRIRRSRAGTLGAGDPQDRGDYVLEHSEPGFGWQLWRDYNDLTSAQWDRFTIWGGPRPVTS